MSTLLDSAPSVSQQSVLTAAFLLLARTHLRRMRLPHPSAQAILDVTKVSKSRAYELMEALPEALSDLVQPVGRPKKASPTSPQDRCCELMGRVLEFLYRHPGAVTLVGGRHFYADEFRHHILELRASYAELHLEAFARVVHVPLGTIEGWLRVEEAPSPKDESATDDVATKEETSLHVQTIIDAWRRWCGPFQAFVEHVKKHLRIPHLGRSLIARILFEYNERIPRRRAGRSPDEGATRGTFDVFFPNAQWIGDGMQVPVEINGERFDFNLELNVDAYSGAFVGVSIRDEEDSAAVVEAFREGVVTTGAPPLALLLDNRSSNHTDEVDQAIGDTVRMRATLRRAQNKAHVEGGFGLFSQDAPPLEIRASTSRELARELLRLRVQTFARTLNHRPRRDRSWRTRIDLYREKVPTEDEVKAARRSLEERMKKIERARATELLRTDPVVMHLLDEAFMRLGILDPERHVRRAIARYGRDVAIEALATYEGKKTAGSLPHPIDDARYVLGIARNIAHLHEADEVTLALLRERLAVRDHILVSLERERDQILANHATPTAMLRDLIDRATTSDRNIDRFFWIDATANLIKSQPPSLRKDLFCDVARRVHATFVLRPDERSIIERRIARLVWPV